jgi:hypothetical protein
VGRGKSSSSSSMRGVQPRCRPEPKRVSEWLRKAATPREKSIQNVTQHCVQGRHAGYVLQCKHGGSLPGWGSCSRSYTQRQPCPLLKKKRGYTGMIKRLRRNGYLEYQKAANSSAQTVTLEAQPQIKAPVCEV